MKFSRSESTNLLRVWISLKPLYTDHPTNLTISALINCRSPLILYLSDKLYSPIFMSQRTVSLQKSILSENSVSWIEWHNPYDPQGFIDWEQFLDIKEKLQKAIKDQSVSSIVIYSPGRHFSPGWKPEAWLTHSTEELGRKIQETQEILLLIRESKKVIIAAVHGRCLGPGMELALACHGIVGSIHSSTVFGMEERNLGLVPSLGATVLLPRYLGLQSALHILLSGRTYSYDKAVTLNLIQHVVTPDQLLSAAGTYAEAIRKGRKRNRRKNDQNWVQQRVEKLWVGRRLIFRQTADRIDQTGHSEFVAPGLTLNATDHAWRRGEVEGLKMAKASALEAVGNPGTQTLLQLRRSALDRQLETGRSGKDYLVRRATILGGGRMGMGLVKLARKYDLDVHLVERNRDRLQVLSSWIQKFQAKLFSSETYFPDQAAEFIIESVDEEMDRKREVLSDAEKYLEPSGFLATNTSTLLVSDLAKELTRPEQLIGMHFFMPPGAMPLVEIIPGEYTSDEVIERAKALAAQLGKVWIEVKDSPGFFCTRVLGVYLHEAMLLLEEGADLQKIDYVLSQFGFVNGPFRFMDMAGLDLIQKVIDGPVRIQMNRYGDLTSSGIRGLVKNGFLGQKSGKGFYLHTKDSQTDPEVNPDMYAWFGGLQRQKMSTVRIQHRMVLALVNEAARCLEEGIISRPEDGDLGAVYGLGFPAFVGGPFRFAEQLGIGKLVHMLEELREDHGLRFEPSALLREKVESGLSIYR